MIIILFGKTSLKISLVLSNRARERTVRGREREGEM